MGGHYRKQLSVLTWTMFILLVVVFQMKAAISNIYNGLLWFTVPFFLVITNDTMAYFTGKAFGRRFYKGVFLNLSPNKTLEGFIGGGICTMIIGFFLPLALKNVPILTCSFEEYTLRLENGSQTLCLLSSEFQPQTISYGWMLPIPATYKEYFQINGIAPIQLHGLALALFASTVAPFGGFLASAIKRAYGLKDFSNLVPGHGGIVDRMDCQFVMALCTYVHYQTFVLPRIEHSYAQSFSSGWNQNVANIILAAFQTMSPHDQSNLLSQLNSHAT